jgi:hypothetical protein
VNVAVVFPWRPQPGRLRAYEFAKSWWRDQLPSATFAEVDTDHDEFNLAACRNAAVRAAESAGADVAVLSDADTVFVPADSLHRAIAEAPDGRLHLPFSAQRYLSEDETESLYEGAEVPLEGHHGNGACYIVTPDAYWRAGGSDERLSGWGGDDDQLVAACMALIGVKRHYGTALSLWHPAVRDVGSERHKPNAELAERYWRASRSPRRMRELIEER